MPDPWFAPAAKVDACCDRDLPRYTLFDDSGGVTHSAGCRVTFCGMVRLRHSDHDPMLSDVAAGVIALDRPINPRLLDLSVRTSFWSPTWFVDHLVSRPPTSSSPRQFLFDPVRPQDRNDLLGVSSMTTETSSSSSYDRLPYASYAYAYSHPGNLSMLAQLFGMQPADVDRCRVLEIGSAAGGNLIPMAMQFPESQCVGIDASVRQIEEGRQVVRQLELNNIDLRHLDVLDFDDRMGKFDYIICHGVYSWVPPNVQTKILNVCRDHLADHGVAYISYNTYPGWYLRRGVREMMAYHASGFDDVENQVGQSRALVDFLAGAVAPGSGAYQSLLHDELSILKSSEDSYIYHEHLEDHNEPVFFHQFVSRAEQSRLRFLCEAHFTSMLPHDFSEATQKTLSEIAPDIIQMEQYMDFLRNRRFRQTLLCHDKVVPGRSIQPERIEKLFVSAPLKRQEPDSAAAEPGAVVFEHASGKTLTVRNPIQIDAFDQLAACWPDNCSIDQLAREAHSRTPPAETPGSGDAAGSPDAAGLDVCRSELCETILELFSSNLVSLWGSPLGCDPNVADRPLASPLARHQVRSKSRVTSLRHESVHLNSMECEILRRLDGETDIDQITEALLENCVKVEPGENAPPPREGQKPTHEELRGAILNRLERLAGAGLLMRQG